MTNNSIDKKSIKDAVLAKIKAGQAKMLPKWHFILKTTLAALGIVIIALTLLYLVSFILFALRQNGAWFVPIFGFRGIGAFLSSLPWLLIAAVVGFLILFEILVKRYSFGYRKPLIYSLVGIIVFVAVAGFIVSRVGLHQGIFKYAEEKKLPFAGHFYREYGLQRFDEIHPGVITEIMENGFRITNKQNETLTVVVSQETRFPLGIDFKEGDEIVALGRRDDSTVQAFGIRKIDDGMFFPSRDPGQPPGPDSFYPYQ